MSESLAAKRLAGSDVPALAIVGAELPLVATYQTADDPSADLDVDLLRFTTAGSVDDGKSTLIGRLLYDTRSIFQDQLEAVEQASRRRGEAYLNLALFTDGLRAEREQNITIDVAYRYFATPKRKFIIADTPGHIQYTRNMVTGASTAELAIVLVDARKGVLTQSKRHGFLASLLGIPHLVVAVNKMDLVEYRQDAFEQIVREYSAFAEKLNVGSLVFIPISALRGDNVAAKSEHMPWYTGATLLHQLETVNVGAARNLRDFRFPVQYVIRPHQDFRGFAGRVASGTIQPGEEILVLPSGRSSRIRGIQTGDGPVPEAAAGDSVVLTIDDDIDISRGEMIVRKMNLPTVASRIEAAVCWLGDAPLKAGTPYMLAHTTRRVTALVEKVVYRIDVDTLHRQEVQTLQLNDIGRVQLSTAQPIFFDAYAENSQTGSFILIDPYTNATVAAGMIRGEAKTVSQALGSAVRPAPERASPGAVWQDWNIGRSEREQRNGHRAAVIWFTGLSGAGKSTIARALERELFATGFQTMLLDGDQLRHGLCGDLGFSPGHRSENVRRAGEVARLFFEQGSIVLCTFVSPSREDRARVRALFPDADFLEVYVRCELEVCRRRDPKGLYARATAGAIVDFTGISAPYEEPEQPDLLLDSTRATPGELVERIWTALRDLQIVPDSAV
jgi:bifunctional enzyme CysN/CysC